VYLRLVRDAGTCDVGWSACSQRPSCQVFLTKDAMQIMTVFKKMGVVQDQLRQAAAGCLKVRLRLIPLAANVSRARMNLAAAGAAAGAYTRSLLSSN